MKYKEWKAYKCMKPLTLKHLYLPPDKITIQPDEIWWLVSSNKSKGVVTLERKTVVPLQTRCKISTETFKQYFIAASEGE